MEGKRTDEEMSVIHNIVRFDRNRINETNFPSQGIHGSRVFSRRFECDRTSTICCGGLRPIGLAFDFSAASKILNRSPFTYDKVSSASDKERSACGTTFERLRRTFNRRSRSAGMRSVSCPYVARRLNKLNLKVGRCRLIDTSIYLSVSNIFSVLYLDSQPLILFTSFCFEYVSMVL
jgi:hypothetical protein